MNLGCFELYIPHVAKLTADFTTQLCGNFQPAVCLAKQDDAI